MTENIYLTFTMLYYYLAWPTSSNGSLLQRSFTIFGLKINMIYPLKQNYLPSVSKTIYRCGNVCSLYLRPYEYVPLCFPPNLTNANFFLPSMTIYYQNTVFISWENRVNKRTTNSIVRCTRMLSSSICIRVMLWYSQSSNSLICNN